MCDSNHLPTKATVNKMPPDVPFSPKPEHWTSSNSRLGHPNPDGPNQDMVAATTLRSSSDQSNCPSDFQSHQLSSSQMSFEDTQNAPNWKNHLQKKTEAGVNHVNTESKRNLEQLPLGNETKNAPSTEEFELRPPAASTESTGEARLQFCDKTKAAPSTDRAGKLEGRSCTSESERRQKHATSSVNGERTMPLAESCTDNTVDDDNQHFFTYRSETESDAGTIETETRLDVSSETKPCFSKRDSETHSRLEPCTETKTGFDATSKTQPSFGDTGQKETGFDETFETQTGFGYTRENKTGFDKRNSEKDRRSSSSPQSKFDASAIGTVTHELLQRTLAPVTYDPQRCRILGHDLAGQILAAIIGLTPKRYKLVTFVSIGSLQDNPGIQFGSRCLWDAETDELMTVRYANETLFAVVMVYALYRE